MTSLRNCRKKAGILPEKLLPQKIVSFQDFEKLLK